MEVGGIQSVLLELLPAYEKFNNFNITLITKYSEYTPISNRLSIYNILKFRPSKINSFYFFFKSFFKIIQVHKKKQIDVLNIHSYYYNLIIPLIIHIFFKIPLLITAPTDFKTAQREEFMVKQNSIFAKFVYYGWMKFFKIFIKKIKNVYVQAINKKIYKDFIELKIPKENIIIIPNGISIKKYLGIEKSNQRATHFAYVGRLIESKNLRFLIKVFRRYLNQYPTDKLLIYGEGPEKKYISKFISKNNLEKEILLFDFESNKRKIYSNINVIVNPSFGEGVPMTILEAILTNTFGIVSDVYGHREIIKHNKTGFLFNPFDERDLLKQLYQFKENQNIIPEILNRAKNQIISNYSTEVVTNKIYQFLKSKILNTNYFRN